MTTVSKSGARASIASSVDLPTPEPAKTPMRWPALSGVKKSMTRMPERIERLILHGSQRQWLAYLHEVVELMERTRDCEDPAVGAARDRAATVIANHHNLLLALPGPGARLTTTDRARLDARHQGAP